MKAIYQENGQGGTLSKQIAYVSVEEATLWSEPNITSKRIGTLSKGTVLEILEVYGSYFPLYKIPYQRQTVWISAFNVTVSER